jgi:polysulfide reductase-like protein
VSASYYGQPVIKPPVWTSEVPLYFFTGGLAGASAGLGLLAGLRGDDELARRAWGASLAGIAVSPPLLISDLGRPERFLNMLRMLKVTSPMSVGSWVLAAAAPAVGVSAVNAWTGRFPRIARFARPAAAGLGLPLSTYTAALLANTSVPVWHEARGRLPFVFAAGAGASAGGVAVAVTPADAAAPARRLVVGASIAELIAIKGMYRGLGGLGEPYREGPAGRFARVGQALTAAGAAVVGAGARRSRAAGVAGGALVAAGALAERFSVFHAGRQSAADPKYTIGPQRKRVTLGAHSAP